MDKSKDAVTTNPYGANQYQLDPRQKLTWDLYVDPKSSTFGNGLQSAIQAGYEPEYAAQITVAPWFLEKLRTLNMLDKAENNLNDILDIPAIAEDGKVDSGVLRIKADVSKFVAERVGKDRYSSRQEITGKGGEPVIASPFNNPKLQAALKPYEDKIIEVIANDTEKALEVEAPDGRAD